MFSALRLITTVATGLLAGAAVGGEARVVHAEASVQGDLFRIAATVAHGDTGWDHYADAWRVEAPDGAVLGRRTLHHPHVTEQPFTRTLSGVAIPDGLDAVIIRARDSVHGWGEATITVTLPDR